ncbi:hypothetical protein WN55_00444 [Dufourea novaeangliae]|uniref:Uncharacterized protein n=1 Tax=Dufourea novaeangliae TaxID=178035 RepID=A0A154PES6_DUFNO|nr:hypothetical protein WN55_00444 [Dufourea novaeangliae]
MENFLDIQATYYGSIKGGIIASRIQGKSTFLNNERFYRVLRSKNRCTRFPESNCKYYGVLIIMPY